MYCMYNMYTFLYSIHSGLVLHKGCVSEKLMPIRMQKFPLKHCFWDVRGLTASSRTWGDPKITGFSLKKEDLFTFRTKNT